MAPKKQKVNSSAASSSHQQAVPDQRFVSVAAEERYQQFLGKKCIPERGLPILDEKGNYGETVQIINQRKWHLFCKQPGDGVESVVREFYANAPEHTNYKVFVRDKQVSFSSKSINRFYKLPDIPLANEGYRQFLESNIDYQAVVDRLCYEGTEWEFKNGQPVKLRKLFLHKRATAWMYFMSAKLLPMTHFSSVSRDRALLIYAIMEGLSINVGRMICNHIEKISTTTKPGGLGYPMLITALCVEAGVPIEPTEVLIPPQPAITERVINGYATPQGRGRGNLESDDSDEDMPPADNTNSAQPQTPASDMSSWMASMEQQLQQLQLSQSYTVQQNDYIIQQNRHQMEYYQQRTQYESEYMQSFNSLLGRWDLTDENPVVFPTPPLFHSFPYPPPQPPQQPPHQNEED